MNSNASKSTFAVFYHGADRSKILFDPNGNEVSEMAFF
jgi:hypothetical protein